jgi:hypothetical protein
MHCKVLNETSLILGKKNFQKVCEVPTELYVLVKEGTETAPNNFTNYNHFSLGQVLTQKERQKKLTSPLYFLYFKYTVNNATMILIKDT